ncbi:MAG: hypothetical protein AAB870_00235, partial [Patescibacteria group bacterium]
LGIPRENLELIDSCLDICISEITKETDKLESYKKSAIAGTYVLDITARGLVKATLNLLKISDRIPNLIDRRRAIEQITISNIERLSQYALSENSWSLTIK